MEVGADGASNMQTRGKRDKATQHFLLDPREYLIHIAKVVDATSIDLQKARARCAPGHGDLPRRQDGGDFDSEAADHEEVGPPERGHRHRRLLRGARVLLPHGRAQEGAGGAQGSDLPKMEFWSGLVPRATRPAPRTPPGPPPNVAKAGPSRTWAPQPPHRRQLEAAVPMASGAEGSQFKAPPQHLFVD